MARGQQVGHHPRRRPQVHCIVWLALASEQKVILRVATYPDPDDLSAAIDRYRAMMQPYADRPKPSDPLEMQGRMTRFLKQQLIAAIRQLLKFIW